jgi:hypothetical protein
VKLFEFFNDLWLDSRIGLYTYFFSRFHCVHLRLCSGLEQGDSPLFKGHHDEAVQNDNFITLAQAQLNQKDQEHNHSM